MQSKPRIVCAALRNYQGRIICGPRHYDRTMFDLFAGCVSWRSADQGFVDQFGTFYSREAAFKIAEENNQIIRRVGGDKGRLFSENLY